MADKASVGDTIVITDPNLKGIFGLEFCVVKPTINNTWTSDKVWCTAEQSPGNANRFWVLHSSYEITRRVADTHASHNTKIGGSKANVVIVDEFAVVPLVSCPDCHGTGQIELFTSTRKCKCCL